MDRRSFFKEDVIDTDELIPDACLFAPLPCDDAPLMF
jgi:hypothetical protein